MPDPIEDRTLVLFPSPSEPRSRAHRAKGERRVVMRYDGATTGRRGSTLAAPASSADAAAFGQRGRLRNVARDLVRNSAVAARVPQVIAANVVGGAGIVPSIECEDAGTKAAILSLLKRHFTTPGIDAYGELTLAALQTQIMSAVVTDGEVLIRKRMRTGADAARLALPLQLQVMEVDHLSAGQSANGPNEIIEGVEYDARGRIVAYHLYGTHPGATQRRRRLQSERVPADEILHIRRMDRPGQTRGVSWLAPVILSLGDLRDFTEAELVKQKMAGMMAFVVKRNAPSADGTPIEEMAPGLVLEIDTDEELTTTTPPSREGYADFLKVHVRQVAAAVGLTYEALSGDLEGVSFTSGRMGRMEMNRLIETWQTQIMIAQFCDRLAAWLDDVIPLRMPRPSTLPAWSWVWTPPRRPIIDPAKEIPAALLEIESGLTSRQRKQRELGLDPDAILEERREDMQADAVYGLAPQPARPPAPAEDDEDDEDA